MQQHKLYIYICMYIYIYTKFLCHEQFSGVTAWNFAAKRSPTAEAKILTYNGRSSGKEVKHDMETGLTTLAINCFSRYITCTCTPSSTWILESPMHVGRRELYLYNGLVISALLKLSDYCSLARGRAPSCTLSP